jgi:hypothetical protein
MAKRWWLTPMPSLRLFPDYPEVIELGQSVLWQGVVSFLSRRKHSRVLGSL